MFRSLTGPVLTALLTLGTWSCGCSPAPPKPTPSGDGEVELVEVTEQDITLGFAKKANRDHDDFAEMYVMRGKMENGGTLYARLRVTNFGPSADGRADFLCHVKMPDGVRHSFKVRRNDKKWKWGTDSLMADLDGAKITGGIGHLEVDATKDGKQLSFKVKSNHKPLQPVPPQALVGGDSFYQTILMIPHGQLEGAVTLPDGQKIDIKAGVHMELRRTNVPPYQLGKRFYTLQDISTDATVHIWGLTLTDDLGGASYGFVMKATDDDIVAYTPRLALSTANSQKDKETGYGVPKGLSLKPVKGEGMTASVTAGKLTERNDELKNLSWIERTVAERFAKPYSFRHDSDYSITVPGKDGAEPTKIEGKAEYIYQRLN